MKTKSIASGSSLTLLPFLLLGLTSHAIASSELAEAAAQRTQAEIIYDGSYRKIPYPNGDVPPHLGVCTDVVIRSYRSLGVDLQQLVHEDMARNFEQYPKNWGLEKPDSNIDHRRVPNLETFFSRHGQDITPSLTESEYVPGDIVSWRLDQSLPHIGIISNRTVLGTRRHYVIHNIGRGPREEDMLFDYPVHGHFRYDLNEIGQSK